MFRLAAGLLVTTLVLAGCQSTSAKKESWVSSELHAVEAELESIIPGSLKTERARHFAAAAILLALIGGCWSRVVVVNRREAAANFDEDEADHTDSD